ncbi:MAG: tRNA 4-thiouridine(8) synthase ThiI [Bacilli bacterium]|jgi:thiamine biosynthesis protein ThiI|nr:tRNA 4-thiouridine(8) synthase ThiI [Bacilli bacterium]
MYNIILVRYGEMTLKKANYKEFLKAINANIKRKLKRFSKLQFSNTDYRFYIHLNGEDYLEVIKALDTISGLASYSPCLKVNSDLEEVAKQSIFLIKEENLERKTFKVETKRSNKTYPLTSQEITQKVAGLILKEIKIEVDVHHPDFVLNIELRNEGTYIYLRNYLGMGGLPAGTGGNGLLMMSGGIDSPVAGFLALRKGITLKAIHFASPPHTSNLSLQKVVDLTKEISKYSEFEELELLVVPFTEIQVAIQKYCNPTYLITLMRRAMYKIAEQVALKEGMSVIVNGESVGQVASQTVESMMVVNEVTNFPVIRPLVAYDKQEIVDIAKKINTYDVSILPYEDCCTVFVPKHPVIRPKVDYAKREEEKYEMNQLIKEAVSNIKRIALNYNEEYFVGGEDKDKYEI